jgi:flagellar biosynthesis anti-sigma factor FlgM
MRVPGSSAGSVERTGETPVRREATEATEAKATQGSEAVVVGSRSKEVSASSARAEAARSQKLERIQAALDGGTYKVDFAAVAEKLVDEELARAGA